MRDVAILSAVRTPIAWWGSLGFLITLSAVQNRDDWRGGWMRPLLWLWPNAAWCTGLATR